MTNNLIKFILSYSSELLKWSLTTGVRVLLILLVFAALWFAMRFLIGRFARRMMRDGEEGSEKDKRVHTLSRVLSLTGGIALFLTALMMTVSELGIDVKPFIASLGIGGVALGFGAQSLVKDIIGGFFMLLEDQVREGDVVEAAGKSGLVEKFGLRVLVLRDFAGNRIIVPNSEIRSVTNMTYGYSRYVFDIPVGYGEDLDRAIELVREVGDDMSRDTKFKGLITEPLEIFGVDKFDESAIIVKARVTTKPIRQWEVGREFNRRLKLAFDREGIAMPLPHRVILQGGAPMASEA